MGEYELNGGEDHDEESGPDGLAAGADGGVGLLEGLASGDHVDDVGPDLHHQLLRDHDPEPELLPEGVLPQLVVPVEPPPGDCLVHLDHLPQREQGYDPRQQQDRNAGSPMSIIKARTCLDHHHHQSSNPTTRIMQIHLS